MKTFDPVSYREMVRSYQENDDPLGWFDSIYSDAAGDHRAVFWADLIASPYLVSYLKEQPAYGTRKKAVVVGCGVGDDAEALASYGYEVVAFDIAPTAIELCQKRYPDSDVTYLVADLFDCPTEWKEAFDVVYECNTIQVLPGTYRTQARDAMVSLLAPKGEILVSCRSREEGTQEEMIPLPLDKNEIDGFKRCGLQEQSFLAYDDDQEPSVPHFFGIYKRVLY